MGSLGTASRYGIAAADLKDRGMGAVETAFVPRFHHGGDTDHDDEEEEGPRAVRALASELVTMPPNDVVRPVLNEGDARACCAELLRRLSAAYEKETLFSKAMFDAMADGLRRLTPPWVGVEVVDETKIVLTQMNGTAGAGAGGGGEFEYAAGLAREAAQKPRSENGGILLDPKARTDHAWGVYRRPAGSGSNNRTNWKVWRVLAVVDFKRGYSKWNLPRSNGGAGNVDADSLVLSRNVNGPLAQVIMYSVAHAAPGIASLGELPGSIPFAVVQCRTEDASPAVDVGWVHGNVVTAEACGELYSFSVDAYGPVHSQEASNGPPLAAYLDVMTKGVQVANRWFLRLQPAEQQQQQQALPVPHPLSGRVLRFGERMDNPSLTVIGNATLLATPVLEYCADGTVNYRVHQGELFRALVDLTWLRRSVTKENRVSWCPDAYPDVSGSPRAVLIKVTSQACFNLLIQSASAYLYTVADFELEPEQVRLALSGSLYGFYRTADDCGLVQLLPDLRSLGYASLPDGDALSASGWGALWSAFAFLVQKVLVPLARAGIVHSDIRAGYDGTANLLYNEASRSMRLIDLDSLCKIETFSRLRAVDDSRYLSAKRLPGPLKHARAIGFVLGQVLCAAEVWLGAIPRDDVNANAMVRRALTRREARAADGVEGGNHISDAGGGGSGSVFDGRAFDAEGNFNAVVNEDLIIAALEGYQAKFDRLSRPVGVA